MSNRNGCWIPGAASQSIVPAIVSANWKPMAGIYARNGERAGPFGRGPHALWRSAPDYWPSMLVSLPPSVITLFAAAPDVRARQLWNWKSWQVQPVEPDMQAWP